MDVGSSYGISESSCYRNIKWIEDTLIKHPEFALPGRKALLKSDRDYQVVLIDAAETPIERPKKIRTKKVICTAFSKVKRHDFRLFKESNTKINPSIQAITDTEYQSLQKLHSHCELPKKKTKKNLLIKQDKKKNQELGRKRVANGARLLGTVINNPPT